MSIAMKVIYHAAPGSPGYTVSVHSFNGFTRFIAPGSTKLRGYMIMHDEEGFPVAVSGYEFAGVLGEIDAQVESRSQLVDNIGTIADGSAPSKTFPPLPGEMPLPGEWFRWTKNNGS